LDGSINIIIDKDFRELLPPLPAEVYEELEKSIISEGCRDAIVLWNDVIVDGHNRYTICQKHGLPFRSIGKDFGSRDEAMIWIISTQCARRQLTQEEITYLRGLQYNLEKQLIPNAEGKNQFSEEVNGNSCRQPPTAKRIAEQYNVGERTIRNDGKAADVIDKIGKVSPDAKKKILSGKSSVTKRELVKLNGASDKEITAAANQIADGTYAKKEKAASAVKAGAKTPVTSAPPMDVPAEKQLDEAAGKSESDNAATRATLATVPETDAKVPMPAEQPADVPADKQPDEPADAQETIRNANPRVPEGWDMPEPIRGKKQTWCAFISAGIDALDSVIGNIEKDLQNKLPLIETQAERDFLRSTFQSYIDRQLEIIKTI
jgi:ParB-like chromosome segregation protein Spo0J